MSQCRLQTETKQDLVNHSGTPPSVMRSAEPKKRSGVEQEKVIRVTVLSQGGTLPRMLVYEHAHAVPNRGFSRLFEC